MLVVQVLYDIGKFFEFWTVVKYNYVLISNYPPDIYS